MIDDVDERCIKIPVTITASPYALLNLPLLESVQRPLLLLLRSHGQRPEDSSRDCLLLHLRPVVIVNTRRHRRPCCPRFARVVITCVHGHVDLLRVLQRRPCRRILSGRGRFLAILPLLNHTRTHKALQRHL